MLHSMTIRLIHVHQLQTIYLCYGVKCQSGVIWGHLGQKVIFSKNATSATEYMVLSALCNIVYPCYHVTHKYALTWDSQLHSLVQGQLGITSADRVRRLWRQHVSSFFFCQHFKDLYLWHALTDFDQTWYQVPLPPPKHDPGVKGHVGVTGVKKVIFTKNATSPTDYRVWSCDSCTCISLTPSTKVMGLKIHPGSFGVTGVKKVIFTKNATSTNYRVWSCDSCTYISLTPSTKVMGLKIHPGSFGVTGVKRSFSLKTLLLLQFTGYGHVTHVHASAWPPSTKVMGLKIHPGSFGVTGVKRLFSLKTLLLLQITG